MMELTRLPEIGFVFCKATLNPTSHNLNNGRKKSIDTCFILPATIVRA